MLYPTELRAHRYLRYTSHSLADPVKVTSKFHSTGLRACLDIRGGHLLAGEPLDGLQVTRRKSVQYCVRVGTKCVYQQGNETFAEGEEEKVVVVNVAYLEQHVPFVRDRLKRAGIRLAHLLNSTLGQ